MKQYVALILLCVLGTCAGRAADTVLIEAESFADPGGWSLDTQFVHIMGSPYLLAHGLGKPVEDATTTVTLPAAGKYRVFVRTKDWVARWNAPGQPGKFQLLVNGKALEQAFGTKGAEWHWQEGGTVEVTDPKLTLALHDLTGFEGRCDAIVLTNDAAFTPTNDAQALRAWRKQILKLPDQPIDPGKFDLVVIGGGYGGMGAAISAARMGCRVALLQDRPVLGGNGSSEVRVWSQGNTTLGKFPRLGEIVEELADSAKICPAEAKDLEDEKKETITKAEKNLSLFLNTQAVDVEMKDGRIAAVIARNTRTSEERRFTARLFADCTGHAFVGALAGADSEMAEKGHMGMSNMWKWVDTGSPQSFPETPWALQMNMADFPYPRGFRAEWFWETGFNRHPIDDLEYIRDCNFRAGYGAFNTMKNGDGKDKHVNAKLEWMAYIGGSRESRRLMGDVVLTREDVINKVEFPDGCVPTTWSIDLHVPKEQFAKKFAEDPFISRAIFDDRVDKKNGYPVPYRCFYSRNVPNLFMAGRNISVDRGALGTIRVMRTGGMMGEVVGKAASICVKRECLPRDVYASHFEELKELMLLPGRARRATVNDSIDAEAPLPYTGLTKAAPKASSVTKPGTGLDAAKLPGIVLDDDKATLVGQWTTSVHSSGFVGKQYLHDNKEGKGEKSATWAIAVPAAGKYEVRISYREGTTRSTETPVLIKSANGEKTVKVNQQKAPDLANGFVSLGVFSFTPQTPGSVSISNAGTSGHVVVDAVQLLPAPN